MLLICRMRGERLDRVQIVGVLLAFSGLIVLLLPGWSAPPLDGALMMLGAGVTWGIYSIRGQGRSNPIGVTAGNFLLAVPMALALSLATLPWAALDPVGAGYAIASGAMTSGLGYALWYSVVPLLRAATAATVQLSVPVIVALGGVALLSEPITLRLVIASVAVLGGSGSLSWSDGGTQQSAKPPIALAGTTDRQLAPPQRYWRCARRSAAC